MTLLNSTSVLVRFSDYPQSWQNEPYSLSAMACGHSEVAFVGLAAFEELMREQPSLFPKVLEVLASEVRSARQALTGILGRLGSRPSRVQ